MLKTDGLVINCSISVPSAFGLSLENRFISFALLNICMVNFSLLLFLSFCHRPYYLFACLCRPFTMRLIWNSIEIGWLYVVHTEWPSLKWFIVGTVFTHHRARFDVKYVARKFFVIQELKGVRNSGVIFSKNMNL